MRPRPRAAQLALALGIGLAGVLALAPGSAQAAAYDPQLTWRSLETEHFRISFHGGEEQLAEECAGALEHAWDEVTGELEHRPRRRIEIVLVDRTDSANGYAQTVPLNTIVIYVTAPTEDSTLSSYEDWSQTITTHELTHIIHLDTVEGLPAAVRAVLGRMISVNRVSPDWVIEGLATFEETRHTNAGRGRSTIAGMTKRMAVLDDAFPPLGNMDGWGTDPPGGNVRYLFGQDLIQYISDRAGHDAWTDWVHVYGRSLPYLLPGPRVFDQRLLSLYKDWRADITARYQAQADTVRALGMTPVTRLSDDVSNCFAPTYSPDGSHLVWTCVDPYRGTDTWLAGGHGEEPSIELHGRGATHFSWRPDGQAFAFASSRVVNRYSVWDDVSLHVLGEKVDSITHGARARDPEISPDGREILVVTNADQNKQLARLTVDRKTQPLTDYRDHTQLSTPRYAPDGRTVALSVWQAGLRDLWLFTAQGQPWRRVTADASSEIDPAWSADGRTLYFSSDRTGIFNVYALDLETEHLWQVTNVLGGAFAPSPSPDGTALVFEDFHNHGNEIAWTALDRSRWIDRGVLPRPVEQAPALAQALPAADDPLVRARLAAVAAAAVTPAPASEQAPPPATPDGATDPWGQGGTRVPGPQEPGLTARPHRAHAARGVPGWAVDPAPYPGLEGLGGAFYQARRLGGVWGLPEEPPLGDPALSGLPREQVEPSPAEATPAATAPATTSDDPERAPDEQFATRVEDIAPEEQDYPFTHPVKRYSPWWTLLPPRYLLPTIYNTTFGYQGVLSTSGADTLRRYLYSGSVSYRTDARYLGWSVAAAINRWVPILSAGVYSYTTPYGDIYQATSPSTAGGAWVPSVQSTNTRYWDKRIRAYAQMSYPIDEYRSIFAGWSGTSRQPQTPIDANTYRPFLPTRGFISSVSGGWRYARGKSYAKSISPEDARIVSLVGEVSSPWIGAFVLDDQDQWTGFTQVQVTADWREYRSLPWGHNHVLALKLAGGLTAGDQNRYGSFRLGGSFGESAYYTLPDEWRALRGFPAATVYGDSYYLGSAEYRLPLLHIDRGIGTVPVFLERLSASAFVDAGSAFNALNADAAAATRIGTGAELSGSAVVGWGIPITVRVGYAFAAYGKGGYKPGDLGGLYWWFGSSF